MSIPCGHLYLNGVNLWTGAGALPVWERGIYSAGFFPGNDLIRFRFSQKIIV